MISSVIGLSHLVFTVNETGNNQLLSDLLAKEYDLPILLEFNQSEFRKALLRNNQNLISHISLFKPKFNHLPAIELLHVIPLAERSIMNYGLFIAGSNAGKNDQEIQTIELGQTSYNLRFHIDNILQSPVGELYSDNVFVNTNGCWIIVQDFDSQSAFLKSIAGVKILEDSNNTLVAKFRVINKTFSSFTIILIRDEQNSSDFFNDDIGLSTLGWFSKDLINGTGNGFFNKGSDIFPIEMNGTRFDAKFIYNNKSISHELLKLIY
jgi:hypothetical protein